MARKHRSKKSIAKHEKHMRVKCAERIARQASRNLNTLSGVTKPINDSVIRPPIKPKTAMAHRWRTGQPLERNQKLIA